MPLSFAILLDGGFVRRKLGTARHPIDAAGISAFTARVSALPSVAALRLHRIYFYDARPLEGVAPIPLGGGEMDFGAHPVATRNRSLQSQLARARFDVRGSLAQMNCPVLVAHSPEDEIIPFHHGQRIYDAAPVPKAFLRLAGGHNEGFIFRSPTWVDALAGFLGAHVPP